MQIFVLHTRRRLHGSVLRVCVCIEKLCTWPSKSNKLVLLHSTDNKSDFILLCGLCLRMGVWECAWVCVRILIESKVSWQHFFFWVLWLVLIEMRGRFGQFSIRIERKVKRKMLNDCRKVFHFLILCSMCWQTFPGMQWKNSTSAALYRMTQFSHTICLSQLTQTGTYIQRRQKFFAKVIASFSPSLTPFHSALPLTAFSPFCSLLLFCFFFAF